MYVNTTCTFVRVVDVVSSMHIRSEHAAKISNTNINIHYTDASNLG